MKKNGKRIFLIISLLLVIGFASLSTNMFFNGLLSVGEDSLENAIYFDSVKTSTFSDGSESVYLNTVDDNEFTFALNQETEYLKVMYTVTNKQIQYGTIAHIECTGNMYSTINYSEDLYVEPQTKNTSFFSLSKSNDLSEIITCSLSYVLVELDQAVDYTMYNFELYEDQGEIGKIDFGDQIKLGSEYFYVYDVVGDKLKLISKYNINNTDYTYQDKNGDINAISFDNLSNNLKLYENKLHQMGIKDSISLDIISKEEVETFVAIPNYLKNSVYWTNSSYDENSNWYMSNSENFESSLKDNVIAGIRPILTIDNPFSIPVYENAKTINDVNNLVNLAINYYNDNSINTLTTIPYEYSTNLLNANYNGTSGNIYIKPDGRVAFQGFNENNKCVVKRYDSNEVEIFDNTNNICELPIYKNLIKNGYGEYGNNTNFSEFIYNPIDNSFSLNLNSFMEVYTDNKFEIDNSKKYKYSIDAKTDISDVTYIGFKEFDIDKKVINADNVMFVNNSLTKLTYDLNPGDTVVHLENLSNWENSSSTENYKLGFITWDYKDSTGYQYLNETYSKNTYPDMFTYTGINKSTNTILLKEPWSGSKIEVNTYLSQMSSGNNFNYCLLQEGVLPQDYQNYTQIITGVVINNNSSLAFRYGAKYATPSFIFNYSGVDNVTSYIKNIIFEEIDE